MRSPITYYGGKQMMAELIIARMPEHRIYHEPFFGGGAVYFAKPKSSLEAINDLDGRVMNFYMQIQSNFDELASLIRRTPHSEQLHKTAKDIYYGRIETDSDLLKAWSLFLVTNQSFGGNIHGGWKWCNGTHGGHSGRTFANKREFIEESLYERMKETQISCRDAIRSIIDRDTPDTFHYIDPPYPGMVQGHYRGYSFKDFFELLSVISNIKGKFLLSSFSKQTLKYFILKNAWEFQSFNFHMKVANLGMRQKNANLKKFYKTEILTMNFKPNTQTEIEFL
jgi:DNA adenine methylase